MKHNHLIICHWTVQFPTLQSHFCLLNIMRLIATHIFDQVMFLILFSMVQMHKVNSTNDYSLLGVLGLGSSGYVVALQVGLCKKRSYN